MEMKLYKNGKEVLSITGKLVDTDAVFGNTVYDTKKHILTKEDASYKYLLDFDNDKATVDLKDYNQSLPLKIKTIKKDITTTKHKIIYNIESDNKIENILEINF